MSAPSGQLTVFQQRISDALSARPHTYIGTHWIAQQVFPSRWLKRSGRGALIGHIDRVASALPDVYRDRFVYAPASKLKPRRQPCR